MKIGIDLGGTKIEGILLNDNGEEIKRYRLPTPANEGYHAIMQEIYKMVNHLELIAGSPCSVGIGTPGSISKQNGKLRNSNTICLNNQPFKQDIEFVLDRECRIENDANCFALSEAIDGSGKDSSIVFGIILGTGVGGGIVVNKTLLSGHHHIAGEWGHNVLYDDGPTCYCGKSGCVETFLSGPGLIKNYRHTNSHYFSSAQHLFDSADAGNKDALITRNHFIENLAKALATVINIIDPDIIVFGGGLSNNQSLYELTKKQLGRFVFSDFFETLLCQNTHGDSSGVRGAAWLW